MEDRQYDSASVSTTTSKSALFSGKVDNRKKWMLILAVAVILVIIITAIIIGVTGGCRWLFPTILHANDCDDVTAVSVWASGGHLSRDSSELNDVPHGCPNLRWQHT